MSSRTRCKIVPEVEGRIVEVGGKENQHVEKGHLLFRLDDSQYQVAVQQAEAQVASARLDVERLKAAYAKALSDQQVAAQALSFAQDTFNRQDALQKRGVVAQSGLDQARMNLQTAEAGTRGAEQAVLGAKAALAGNPDIADRRASRGDAGARDAGEGHARPRPYQDRGASRWRHQPDRPAAGRRIRRYGCGRC